MIEPARQPSEFNASEIAAFLPFLPNHLAMGTAHPVPCPVCKTPMKVTPTYHLGNSFADCRVECPNPKCLRCAYIPAVLVKPAD